jgi:SAM-dependent methyltransferase
LGADEIQALVSEEISLANSTRGRWHAEYLGRSYRSAVEMATAHLGRGSRTALKTDLWNECLGGAREIAGHFHERDGLRFFGLDLLHSVCVEGRSRVPAMHVVQADIRALPFRAGSFDAVLDLSTLDHLPEAGVADAIGEYRRVLRVGGALLLIFWQRSLIIRLRLLLKRLSGRREKTGQQYFKRACVMATLGRGLHVVREFVVGSLLIAPQGLTSRVLGRLPARALAGLLRLVVRVERSAAARPLLKHVAGLYGIVALRQPDPRGDHAGGLQPT